MKKQRVQLIVLAAVLAVLAVCFLGLRFYNRSQQEAAQDEPEGESVMSVDGDLTRIVFDYSDTRYEYDKADGTWYYTPDHSLSLSQYRLESIERQCKDLRSQTVIKEVSDLAQYGLADGARMVTVETENESYTLWIGNQNAITSEYYLCLDSDKTTVYSVKSAIVTAFNFSVEDITVEPETTEPETETAKTGSGTGGE